MLFENFYKSKLSKIISNKRLHILNNKNAFNFANKN